MTTTGSAKMRNAPEIDANHGDDERLITLCGQRLPHPGHVCAFFDSREEKYDTLAPFFIDGIAEGDRIINVVEGAGREEHVRQLAAAHVPVSSAVERDQLRVLTAEETYLRDGIQSLDGMLDLLRDALEAAEREGRCIRTCGEMSWIGRSTLPLERILEYEARVNEFVPTFTCTLLCVYDVATTPATLIADILATHQFAIIKGRLRPNPNYIETAKYLEMLRTGQSFALRHPT